MECSLFIPPKPKQHIQITTRLLDISNYDHLMENHAAVIGQVIEEESKKSSTFLCKKSSSKLSGSAASVLALSPMVEDKKHLDFDSNNE